VAALLVINSAPTVKRRTLLIKSGTCSSVVLLTRVLSEMPSLMGMSRPSDLFFCKLTHVHSSKRRPRHRIWPWRALQRLRCPTPIPFRQGHQQEVLPHRSSSMRFPRRCHRNRSKRQQIRRYLRSVLLVSSLFLFAHSPNFNPFTR
jgi:hypothetical protein